MSQQLAFELPFRPALERGDFFVSSANATALAALDNWHNWPQRKMILVGPPGSGKTHLAHVWAQMSGATIVPGKDLASADLPDLAAAGAVVVEDCAMIAGDETAETALFHLHNLLLSDGGALLLTAQSPARDWAIALPDLASRVQAAGLARLEAPDDGLLAAVLIKLFSDRQISVSPALIAFLLPRMDRSFDAARALVADLDAAALARGTAVTRGLAANLLDNR
ncbi:MAG: chromosomal replication initiation ATPase DnaA [Pseudorhodobacter sp.]